MRRLALILSLLVTACAAPRTEAARAHSSAASSAVPTIDALVHPGRFTVVTFFSASCPCQRAHDDRLRALFDRYHARGVDFVAVDAEADAAPSRDTSEARARSYPFPLVSDPEGRLADALGAEYATYTVLLDDKGHVRFRGGIDSDKSHLTDDAKPWLRDAIERVLAGRDPDPAEAKTLGCALRRR
ncbi:Hypothetical protein A7982_08367 [Minicystis rosea]|nr:Hypothetical protein A7982_08367 [Minicystis rosea]